MSAQWRNGRQVRYFERGIEYWWDYPPKVNAELEELYHMVGEVQTEWTYQYPRKRSRKNPSGTVRLGDDDAPVVGATYHLYPKKKLQVNITDGIHR